MANVTLKGNVVNLTGDELNVGDNAPKVTLVAADLSEIEVGNGKQVLVVVPSLDTPVCAAEARKFNEQVAQKAEVVVISMDLPFAMGRFCTTEGINNLKVGSDFRSKAFAKSYGVLLDDGPLKGLTCRAIFIVENGKISYKQIVPEITAEPDYDAVLAAL